jgi:hypothetical protein
MRDETIALLSSVGPIKSRTDLQTILAGQWTWWDDYGEELYTCLAALDIPPMVPLPSKKKGTKRGPERGTETNVTSKRRHLESGPQITAGSEVTSTVVGGSVTATIPAAAVRKPRKKASPEEIAALNKAAFEAEGNSSTAVFFSSFRSSAQPSQNSNDTS